MAIVLVDDQLLDVAVFFLLDSHQVSRVSTMKLLVSYETPKENREQASQHFKFTERHQFGLVAHLMSGSFQQFLAACGSTTGGAVLVCFGFGVV